MPRPTLSQIRAVGDFTSQIRWYLEISKFPNALTGFTTDELNLRCESMGVPTKTGSPVSISIRGHTTHRAGVYTPSGGINLTFVETIDNRIALWFAQWKEIVWATDTGLQVPYTDYIAQVKLVRLDNNDSPIYQYELAGAFPERWDFGGTPGPTEGGPYRPVLGLVYDDFTEESLI